MNISRSDLYRIVLEEYLKEQGTALEEDKARELIDFIKGTGPKPDWFDQDRRVPPPPEVPPIDSSETYPMEKLPRAMSDNELASTIGELIHGRDPGEVADIFETVYLVRQEPANSILQLVSDKDPGDIQGIFQMAFEKLPGVELSKRAAEDPDAPPSTEYGGEEYELRQKQTPMGFEEQLINEVYAHILEFGPAGLGSWGVRAMTGITGNRDDDDEVEEGLDDYPDFEPAYDVMKGEGPPEKAPWHDLSDDPHSTWEGVADTVLVHALEDLRKSGDLYLLGRDEGPNRLAAEFDNNGDLTNRDEIIAVLNQADEA